MLLNCAGGVFDAFGLTHKEVDLAQTAAQLGAAEMPFSFTFSNIAVSYDVRHEYGHLWDGPVDMQVYRAPRLPTMEQRMLDLAMAHNCVFVSAKMHIVGGLRHGRMDIGHFRPLMGIREMGIRDQISTRRLWSSCAAALMGQSDHTVSLYDDHYGRQDIGSRLVIVALAISTKQGSIGVRATGDERDPGKG